MDDSKAAILMEDVQTGVESLREILRERARVLSEIPTPEESGEKISILSFQLGEELYGIELRYLAETRQFVPLRRIPRAPAHLLGVINLRGELLPVFDLCPILGLSQREPRKFVPALLVVSTKGNKLTFAVDQAKDILTFAAKDIHPTPLSLEPEQGLFLRGEVLFNNQPLSLLDIEKILSNPRFSGQINQASDQPQGETK